VTYVASGNANPVSVPASEWVISGNAATEYFPAGATVGGVMDTFLSDNRPASITKPTTITGLYQTSYYLTVSSAHGSPIGQGWYNAGVTADAGLASGTVSGGAGTQYVFTGWSGDASGSAFSSSNAITMNGPKTATANWKTQYQVTFAVSGDGSTSPTGSNVWENAGSLSITAAPNSGYTFSSWSSNTGSITFTNANSASATATIGGTGTITATFAINTYTITVTQDANGAIAPETTTVNYGASQSFTITPSTGYSIASLTVDGSSVAVASSYTFSNVQAAHTITATFAINTYTITASAGANGGISPNGADVVNYGATPTFTITPNTGYHILDAQVDGSSVLSSLVGNTYTFSSIQASHTISATFAITSTTPTVSPSSPRPTAAPSSPTPTISPLSPTPTGSSPSPTPTVPPPSPTPLYLVLAAVIIAAAIIISVIAIKRSRRKLDEALPNPENEYKKTNVLAADEKQEIASLKGTIEKIKNLEVEKKNLLLEIEELKKMATRKLLL
jgi:uncharacterized repeat protein (TIGR02543 family)